MKIISILLAIFPLTILAQQPEVDYKVFDTFQNKTITLDELIAKFQQADVLFYGEEHNDSITHLLENQIFEKSYKANPNLALSMEMFENDVQLVLDEYLKGQIREKNFITEARAWPNYSKDYKPLIEFAKSNNISVIAANTPARYTNMVSRGSLSSLNSLNKSARKYLPPLPIDTATGKYYENFNEMMGGHSSAMGFIFQSQNLWDASMAYHIAKYYRAHKKQKIFHVNGRFHTDERLGIISQLKHYARELKSLNISAFSVDDLDQPNWEKYKALADFIIITKASSK